MSPTPRYTHRLALGAPARAPLFAFARDGAIAWLRESGSSLVAVDTATGEIIRQVRLDPAPFGIGWRVERHGAFFVVRDDREISAYDDATGGRLWKRTWPTHVAFAGERDGRHISVIPAPDAEGVDIALADLATGEFDMKLRVPGTMQFVGAHGTLADELLFIATDERDVFAIDTSCWQIKSRRRVDGTHVLPPVATSAGVHIASIERRDGSSVTHVTSLDRDTGHFISTHTLPGAAHLMTPGTNGLVLESRRSAHAPVERIAFRPESPSVRLTVSKEVDMRLVRNDAPRLPSPAVEARHSHNAAFERARKAQGRHDGDVMLPAPRDGSEGPVPTPRDGLLGLLALLEARSDILTRLVDAFEAKTVALFGIETLGIKLRDPRARWSTTIGRDPCLLDIAENREGDAIATYLYPPAKTGRMPVVLVSRATGEARWLADDFDVWFAGVLHNAMSYAPQAVLGLLDELALPRELPRPLAHATPPPWFFEAHATSWTVADADSALAAGDVEGAERMLVALARTRAPEAKDRLASVYTMLGWDHHRATVVETW